MRTLCVVAIVVSMSCGGEETTESTPPAVTPTPATPEPAAEPEPEAEPAEPVKPTTEPVPEPEPEPTIAADCPLPALFEAIDDHRETSARGRRELKHESDQSGGYFQFDEQLAFLRGAGGQGLELAATADLNSALVVCGQGDDRVTNLADRLAQWLESVPDQGEEDFDEDSASVTADELLEEIMRVSDETGELARQVLRGHPPTCLRDQYVMLDNIRRQMDALLLENPDAELDDLEAQERAVMTGSEPDTASDSLRELVQRCPTPLPR